MIKYNREVLYYRHRLSHQQIDHWLGENHSKEFLNEKMKHLKMVQHFIGITDLLREHEILFTCLKGPLLSQRIYSDPTVRFSRDIDILIDDSKINEIIQLFLENGYQFTEGSFWPKKKNEQKLLLKNSYHISFYNKELLFCVEIHWSLMDIIWISSKRMKILITQNQSEITFSGRKFTVLNEEFELMYLLLHGSRHGWERLKWLVDIKDYPMNKIDISVFNKLIQTFKAERIMGQTNFLLKFFFNKELPALIKQKQHIKLNEIAIAFIESEYVSEYSNEELIRTYLNYYLMFPGLTHKYQIISKMFFRPEDIRVINSPIKMVYFIYRIYSFIKRRTLDMQIKAAVLVKQHF
ncbi:nucleotidyltransferase family protein [Flavobacterium sp. RSP29]|uniref:nucleotidyltransferase family protein n=1 Tax=Flavobacterium sp. RSP29 TaxID=3401731 RepID=UPI003AAC6848